MSVEPPVEIMNNLTQQISLNPDISGINLQNIFLNSTVNPTDPQIGFIAKWCYNQHFNFAYRNMILVVIAFCAIVLFKFMVEYDHIIKEFKWKLGNWIIDKSEVRKSLIFIVEICLILFLFGWVYDAKGWHFLDWLPVM